MSLETRNQRALSAGQFAYDNDAPADDDNSVALERARDEIFAALLTTGHGDVDDERLVINIDADKLRAAYALFRSGARDAALVAFVALTEAAADKAATEESEAFVARRQAESRQEAASDHYDNLKEDGRIA